MSKRTIEIGEKYGCFEVLGEKHIPYITYICKCGMCGNTVEYRSYDIKRFKDKGCGACRIKKRKEDIINKAKSHIGERFGFLEIIDYVRTEKSEPIMLCKCNKCGKESEIVLNRLRHDGIQYCKYCNKNNLKRGRDERMEHFVDGTNAVTVERILKNERATNKNSATGINGVSELKNGKYRAYINFARKQYHLGTYEDIDDAQMARKKAEKERYGNFLKWYAEEYPEKWEKMNEEKK